MDEPFSALDAYLQEELQPRLLELFLHFGKDVILVTHNRNEVFKVEMLSRAEDPFESNVIFRCAGTDGEIWWKRARQKDMPIPTHFCVNPDNVLPLVDRR